VFSSQATSSPSKVSVPSRKQRNQPSSRVRDIEFATDISTSLLAQVRQLQALLAERDEFLRIANLEKSRVELEAQGFAQRVRALDESEQRYKDENWVLESKTHELISAAKEATIREDRLASNLNAVTIEKNNIQRELDELKQADGKLIEENAAAQKVYDFELPDTGDAERTALQRRVDELTTHNQELARAVATRFWQHQSEAVRVTGPDDEGNLMNEATLENPPPSSPSKATPRHGQLESETLKSSLYHSHRMIQNLKSSIHREKTEKIELKRMLQEARDELEQRWGDSNAPASATNVEGRNKMSFKKPPRPKILGAGRRGLTEIEIEEPDWEDHAVESSPARAASERYLNSHSGYSRTKSLDNSDAYQTEDVFEIDNERETTSESEAFQIGAESLDGDSTDELTETESRTDRSWEARGENPSLFITAKAGYQTSFMSTASTSGEEDEDNDMYTPIEAQPQRYPLKMNRGRGRFSGETSHSARNSPAGFTNHQGGQSLFAELEDLGSPAK
jgi:hypothetical protein